MDEAVPGALVTGYEGLIDAFQLPDPNDRHVLAAAVRCRASSIITFNAKDFPVDTLAPLGIETKHPDDFIIEVDDIDPGTLIDAARADISHYRNPPLPPETYIGDLEKAGLQKVAQRLRELQVLLVD